MSESHECIDENKKIGCLCSITALEPNDECPIHGGGIFPPKCWVCGKFIPLQESIYAVDCELNIRVK